MKALRPHAPRGFTLVEVLVVIAIIAALAVVAMAAIRSLRIRAAESTDLTRLRNLGLAINGWASDHNGRLPRSSHSAAGHGELGWQREILPMLGYSDTSRATLARAKPEHFGIEPDEPGQRTPALNVYFELNPDYDDYEGAPKTWRNYHTIPNPAGTILLIQTTGTTDHVMAQYLQSTSDNLPVPRPGRRSGAVLWADGRATLEQPNTIFDPTKNIDRFHPEKAR